ncbi:MAG TPA: S8 family peptidase [Vicinamibacterales bacterium]|nr:S8 family peptidase [Vicinamibacterales bacterium]
MNAAKAGGFRVVLAVLVAARILGVSLTTGVTAAPGWIDKLDRLLQQQAARPGRSRVVVRVPSAAALLSVLPAAQLAGARVLRTLPIVSGAAVDIPNNLLPLLAGNPLVERVSMDRLIVGSNERTSAAVGATAVRQELGYDGTGVGMAIIDSGVTPWHDDLAANGLNAQRVDRFVDFVDGRQDAYDDYGHGTHVAGIAAGNGSDSNGARAGIAPAAHLTVLKVLDGSGSGRISDVIAALDYAVAHKDELGIRIVNLSVAAGVYESYNTDPLTLAARRAVSAGIVVVAAAGNNGRGPLGTPRYGGVTAPGNAPWVLTVGASSHMGTVDRSDDTIAAFSSRGPGAIDYAAKPDVVAPGVGIESLANPGSALYEADAAYLLNGTVPTPSFPYLSLTGTSMATPVVTGTVALMLQANPQLTPNAVKAILQYTAQAYQGYDRLTEGAGFLNAKAAVELSAFLAAPDGDYPATDGWSTQIIWGNHVAEGGRLTGDANAWSPGVTWGDATTPDGERITWGIVCSTAHCDPSDSAPWQPSDLSTLPNIVWGALCGGDDCRVPWTNSSVTAASDTEADTVVWGTSETEGETVVWGTSCTDPSCQPVIWSRQ